MLKQHLSFGYLHRHALSSLPPDPRSYQLRSLAEAGACSQAEDEAHCCSAIPSPAVLAALAAKPALKDTAAAARHRHPGPGTPLPLT